MRRVAVLRLSRTQGVSWPSHPLFPGSCLGCIHASSSSSRAIRKKKERLNYRYTRAVIKTRSHREGDFPLHSFPAVYPRETVDLNDASLDAEADVDRIARLPKPHRVRETLRERAPPPTSTEHGGRAVSVDDLRRRQLEAAAVPKFDPERDMNEGDAAAFAASKARELSRKNYKWMPNPFGPKPGSLGTSPEAEAAYYERYFGERSQKPPLGGDELPEGRTPKPKRERISPKRFWIQPEHITPEPPAVALMTSRELKFAMVNEVHLVMKWRNDQPGGRAAGLPPDRSELWMAFGARASELATGKAWPDRGSTDGTGSETVAAKPVQRACSLSTCLRFLQTMASVQAGPFSALQQLASRVAGHHLKDLRPQQCFFILQALSRLRLRHQSLPKLLERMSVGWVALPHKKLVKVANAVAKLDLAGNLWARPLKLALARALPQLSGRHLGNIKAITVMELLDDPVNMKSYLDHCERTRSEHWYPRHLQMVEAHIHLVHPDVFEELDEGIRLFLQDVRTVAESSRNTYEETDSAEESDGSQSDGDTVVNSGGFDRRRFSSELHQDVSRVLRSEVGVDHHNLLSAGPLKTDIFHEPTMTVVEAAASWQYYLRSPRITALARRREEMLKAMEFRFVRVPYHRWTLLENDDDKAALLHSLLPSDMLSHRAGAGATNTSSTKTASYTAQT